VTSATVSEKEVVLCVGDTTFLDYDKIVVSKRKGAGGREQGGNPVLKSRGLK